MPTTPLSRPLRRLLLPLLLLALAPAASAASLPLDTPLIRDEEVTVTLADLRAMLQRVPADRRQSVLASEEQVGRALDSVFINRKLAREAEEAGLVQDPVARARVRLAREQALSQLRLEQMEQELDREAALQLAKERYRSDREAYRTKEKVRARHILLSTQERDVDAARERARSLAETLQQDPSRFDELAAEVSDDPTSAEKGGLLPAFAEGRMVEPFEKAAFALEPGEVSDPVRTDYGYHVIKLEERIPSRQQSFDEVRDGLVSQIMGNQRKIQRQEKARDLRGSGAKVNEEAIRQIVEEAAAAEGGE